MAKHLSDGFLSEFDGASFFLNADPTVYVDGVAEPIVENVSQGVGETVCEVEQQHQRQSLLPLENATPMMIQTAAETIEVVAEKQQQTEKKQKAESKKASKKRQTEESDLDNPKPLEEAVKKMPGRRGRKPKSKQSTPTKESPNQKSGASKSTGRGKRAPSPIPAQFNKLVSNSLIAGDAVTDFASCVDALIDIQVENVDKSPELMMFFERRYQKRLNVSKAVLEGRITSRQTGLLYDGQYNLSVEDFRDKFGEIFTKSQ
ncbi:hypothetical protein OS493_020777 [Desmophyllum pertusum]|uniref:Uncharacterized protein n=1 Tax=Desmophyllum pertusum TaxID=174260 RepID=A0A9X0CK47_9CNID|nr:hypothetical protein OS493_020777 [Desmophyllum pertusum]